MGSNFRTNLVWKNGFKEKEKYISVRKFLVDFTDGLVLI